MDDRGLADPGRAEKKDRTALLAAEDRGELFEKIVAEVCAREAVFFGLFQEVDADLFERGDHVGAQGEDIVVFFLGLEKLFVASCAVVGDFEFFDLFAAFVLVREERFDGFEVKEASDDFL